MILGGFGIYGVVVNHNATPHASFFCWKSTKETKSTLVLDRGNSLILDRFLPTWSSRVLILCEFF
jgi:hypothetical protein